jgi:hypothetical protein
MHIFIILLQTVEFAAISNKEEIEASADGIVPELNTYLPGISLLDLSI